MAPILLLIYKRYDLVSQVINKVREYAPQRIYISADGPKNNNDILECKQTRELLLANIDWKCEVYTLFRDENLGCGNAVSSGITWFFEHEEEGIILEEDCLPNLDFFVYIEKMLETYRDDSRIMHISGCNFIGDLNRKDDYFFSRKVSIWGWATWRRAWILYDYDLEILSDENFNNYLIPFMSNDYNQLFYWKKIFELLKEKKIDTWDYQWQFTIWLQNGTCIYPSKNLIKNIGFHQNALHTRDLNSPLSNLEVYNFTLKKIIRKKNIKINKLFDDYIFYYIHKEKYDTKFNQINKFIVAIEPSLKDKVFDTRYTFRDKMFLIRKYIKGKLNN
jgi:hypothetical protein